MSGTRTCCKQPQSNHQRRCRQRSKPTWRLGSKQRRRCHLHRSATNLQGQREACRGDQPTRVQSLLDHLFVKFPAVALAFPARRNIISGTGFARSTSRFPVFSCKALCNASASNVGASTPWNTLIVINGTCAAQGNAPRVLRLVWTLQELPSSFETSQSPASRQETTDGSLVGLEAN